MKTINKILSVTVLSLALTDSAFAISEGPYIGGGIGGSKLDNVNDFSKEDNNPELAGKVFAGVNLNSWVGVELGYAKYGDSAYVYKRSSDLISYNYKQDAISLTGKAYLPLDFSSKYNLYGLAGVSYIHGTADTKVLGIDFSDGSAHAYLPTIGAGFLYAVNNHVTSSLEYSYTKGKNNGTHHLAIPNSNLFTFNIALIL